MSTLTFPYSFVPNTNADPNQVNSNFSAVATVVNGNLEASTNVKVATPIAQTSSALLQGSATTLARSDHAHLIQCTEQRTSDPTTGNFIGRRYFNTSTLKERLCIATGGAGTWVTMGNYSAADLPAHEGSHVPTGTATDLLDGPAVQAVRTANQSIISSTVTTAAFNATDAYDTDTMHDPVTNNTLITFTHAGVYRVWATLAFAANGTGDRWAWIEFPTGSSQIVAGDHSSGPAAGQNPILTPSGTIKATAGQTMNLQVFQNSGGPLNMLGATTAMVVGAMLAPCFFGAEWIGTGV